MGIHVGAAGWNIPRPHACATYERWACAVPDVFRFAAKIPKLISHERLLTRARDPLTRFLDETAGLGNKRGPLLLQLPPSFPFDAHRFGGCSGECP